MKTESSAVNRERRVEVPSGWIMLVIAVLLILGAPVLFFYAIAMGVLGTFQSGQPVVSLLVIAVFMEIAGIFISTGFFTLQPNEARVLILFGAYKGTVRDSGFHWGNPFYANGGSSGSSLANTIAKAAAASRSRTGASETSHLPLSRYKISLRARTLNGERLKVNDKRGNPVEIAAIVIWRVEDTAQATFDVDDYARYVDTQSESALRHLASGYAYDHGEENEITLRSGVEEVSMALRTELQERLAKAGVIVEEARLTHLAYAPEIAQAMLRRQQAEAIIAARQKIVHGAVSMVEMALNELGDRNVVKLNDADRAAMVSNLMVVLCSESQVSPVVSTGTQ